MSEAAGNACDKDMVTSPYMPPTGLPRVYDSPDDGQRIDPRAMACLQRNLSADHYLVFAADFDEYASEVSKDGLALTPRVLVLVFGKDGRREFSHRYSARYQGIQGKLDDASMFFGQILRLLREQSTAINKDLSFLRGTVPAPGAEQLPN
jgi:hypothetical protein